VSFLSLRALCSLDVLKRSAILALLAVRFSTFNQDMNRVGGPAHPQLEPAQGHELDGLLVQREAVELPRLGREHHLHAPAVMNEGREGGRLDCMGAIGAVA